MTNHSILHPRVPCCAPIFLDEKGMANTYCQRESGHPDERVKGFPGGHNIVNEAPVAPAMKEDR
jgi:hypothetical protein